MRSTRWTPEQIELLIAMHRDGAPWYEIAARMDRTIHACAMKISKLGLSANRTRRYQPRAAPDGTPCPAPLASPPMRVEPPDPVLAERTARLEAAARRSFTQAFFGDPPPGFSHLDKVRSVASASHPNQNNE